MTKPLINCTIPNSFAACIPYLAEEDYYNVISLTVRLHIVGLEDYKLALEIERINNALEKVDYSARFKTLAKRMKRLYINELRYRRELWRKMQQWTKVHTINLYLRDLGA